MNLQETIFSKIDSLGHADAAKYFGTTENNIRKWMGGQVIPISAAQKVLDDALSAGVIELAPTVETPDGLPGAPEQGQTIPVPRAQADEPKATTTEAPAPIVKATGPSKRFSILCPTYKDLPYATVLSILGQWKHTVPSEIRPTLANLDFEPDTNVHFARNRLATRFLESNNEWSFWMDADMIAPLGNPKWFKRRTSSNMADNFAGKSAIEQLTSHSGKLFVSAVYCERNPKRHIVAQPGMDPRNEQQKVEVEEIRRGPQDKLIEVEWVGFGCVAVHRKVFEDVLERVGGVKSSDPNVPHEFFTQTKMGNQGEDMAFAEKARKAGHKIWLDLSIHAGHIGRMCYIPSI